MMRAVLDHLAILFGMLGVAFGRLGVGSRVIGGEPPEPPENAFTYHIYGF